MKIEKKVCLTSRIDRVALVCEKTGIASAIEMPQIPAINGKAQVLVYVHPLAYWSNVKGLISAGRSYLERLDVEVLAGLTLSAYEHWSLIDRYTLSAQEANAVLCTAGKEPLIDLLVLSNAFTDRTIQGCSALMLEWKDIKDQQTAFGMLSTYHKRLREQVLGDDEQPKTNADRIAILNLNRPAQRLSSGATYVSSKDTAKRQAEEKKAALKDAKKLINDKAESLYEAGLIETKMHLFLTKTLQTGDNLIMLASDTKQRLIAKLEAVGQVDSALIISALKSFTMTADSIFGSAAEQALDSVVETFVPEKILTFAEIVAEKRRKNALYATQNSDSTN